MSRHLKQHLDYLRSCGRPVALSPSRAMMLGAVEARRQELAKSRGGCRRRHQEAAARMAECAAVAERDFPAPPPADIWIAHALDRSALQRTLKIALAELAVLIAGPGIAGVYVTSRLKPRASILAKIAAHAAGLEELDLWDCVGTRVVVPSVHMAAELARRLSVSADVDRMRDYIRSPRGGPDDPYRANHAVVRTRAGFYEVQFVMPLRALVGEVDHAQVRKKAVPFRDGGQEEWLWELSMTANVMQMERSRGRRI